MRTTRIYVDLELSVGQQLLLPTAPSAHLLRVLRLRPGAALTLFNGRGGEYAASLISADKTGARVSVEAHAAIERESALQLTLLQGVARGARMDFIVQKATELGVQRIVPLVCEFSVVRLAAAELQRRTSHWRAVAIAACEQCGRNRLPLVEPGGDFAAACHGASAAGELRLMLLPQAPDTLAALTGGLRSATLLVGPEGGLSDQEQLLAQRGRAMPAHRARPRA